MESICKEEEAQRGEESKERRGNNYQPTLHTDETKPFALESRSSMGSTYNIVLQASASIQGRGAAITDRLASVGFGIGVPLRTVRSSTARLYVVVMVMIGVVGKPNPVCGTENPHLIPPHHIPVHV